MKHGRSAAAGGTISRRDCMVGVVGLSAAFVLGRRTLAQGVLIESAGDSGRAHVPGTLKVTADAYEWSWSAATDVFRLRDRKGREVASAELQPVITLHTAEGIKHLVGKLQRVDIRDEHVTFQYADTGSQISTSFEVRFAGDHVWYEPVRIAGTVEADVVELRWFSALVDGELSPRLSNNVLVVPGITVSSAISAVLPGDVNLDATFSLGSCEGSEFFQLWGLPAHYFCGYNLDSAPDVRASYSEKLSSAFCCGLGDLPAANMLLHTAAVHHSLIFRYNSEHWRHARLPGTLSVGAQLIWSFGDTCVDAIRAYYAAVKAAGTRPPSPSRNKLATMTGAIFSIWGEQAGSQTDGLKLTQTELEDVYAAMRAAGFRVDVFEIDEGWESGHGTLTHSGDRLPGFEQFLDRVHSDGMKCGLWLCPLRCGSPEAVGLRREHMMRSVSGQAITGGTEQESYFFLDVTQPEVERNLRTRLQRMMKRYRPAFLKFDFGYELPPLTAGAPADRRWAGERLFFKALDIISSAVREIDADVVIVYYGLSPLLAGRMDLHSPDDLYAAMGDFDIEANRRFYFSSLMGELGIPTWGSGGYDWQSMPSIWFDSALIGGLGVLADCRGDVRGATPTRSMVALFNGLRETVRHTNDFSIETSAVDPLSPTRAAHAPSWIRRERGKIVGVALRHNEWLGSPGTSRVAGVIESDISVVVTSRTDEELTHATSVAVVPLADGALRLWRMRSMGTARMFRNYADGSSEEEAIRVDDAQCVLHLKTANAQGVPLEWCELRFRT